MHRPRGFTLIEMAVVVAVIAILLGSILVPLATQVEERRFADARRMLEEAREALMGFAVVNGRLPCPASNISGGAEEPSEGGACTAAHNGFLPAVTLGISPTDGQGFALDPWGNRIRYAVSTVGNTFTTNTTLVGMSAALLAGTLGASQAPDLQVCSTAAGISGPPPACAAGSLVSRNAPAVIYSPGPNGLSGSVGADEVENSNGDRLFVSRPLGASGSAGGEFDDVIVWLSPNILYNRMIVGGKLP